MIRSLCYSALLRLRAAVALVERWRVTVPVATMWFFALLLARMVQQGITEGFSATASIAVTLFEAAAVFGMVFLLMVGILHHIVRVPIRAARNVALTGLSVIFIAPIINALHSGEVSYYEFTDARGLLWSLLTFFGQTPDQGITIGYRVEMAIAIAAVFGYALLRRTSFVRAFAAACAAYGVFFVVGALPTIFAWIMALLRGRTLYESDVAALFFSPAAVGVHTVLTPVDALLFRAALAATVFGVIAALAVPVWRRDIVAHLRTVPWRGSARHGVALLAAGAFVAIVAQPIRSWDIFAYIVVFLGGGAVSWVAVVLSGSCHMRRTAHYAWLLIPIGVAMAIAQELAIVLMGMVAVHVLCALGPFARSRILWHGVALCIMVCGALFAAWLVGGRDLPQHIFYRAVFFGSTMGIVVGIALQYAHMLRRDCAYLAVLFGVPLVFVTTTNAFSALSAMILIAVGAMVFSRITRTSRAVTVLVVVVLQGVVAFVW